MTTEVELRPADDDLDYVEELLARQRLPTGDVREGSGRFFVATVAGDRVGVCGLERYGAVGLLRSVVVDPSARNQGYGTAICERLEARARADGVEALYLLTTTAREFFADRGYREVDRERVPEAIRSTTEFSELCPASAVCMEKRLVLPTDG